MTDKVNIIPNDDLNTVRFWVKRELESKYLPTLPEYIEDQLFFQGRSAWTYKYSDLIVEQKSETKLIAFKIMALLKKEFRILVKQYRLNYEITCTYHHETGNIKILEVHPICEQLTNASTQTN